MSDNDTSEKALSARTSALQQAIHEMYETINTTKRLVGERRSRKAVIRQFEIMIQRWNAVYTEASLQEITLHDLAEMTGELRRAYDQLGEETDTVWQQGWKAAVKEMFATVVEAQELLAEQVRLK